MIKDKILSYERYMDNNDQLNDLYEYGTQSSSRFSNSESTGAYYNNDERPTSKTSGAAKASLALGIISIVLGVIGFVFIIPVFIGFICAIIGLILAIVASVKGDKSGAKIGGLITNIIATICGLICVIAFCAFIGFVASTPEDRIYSEIGEVFEEYGGEAGSIAWESAMEDQGIDLED